MIVLTIGVFGRVKRGLVIAGITAFLLLQSNGVFALGLLQAYDEALKNDPVYHSAIYENEAGQQYRAMGRASLLPTVAINYSGSKNRADVDGTNIFGQVTTTHPEYTSRVAVLSLRQPIFNLDGVARYRQGVAQANYSDAQFTGRAQELMVRVVGAYANVQYAGDQLVLAVAQRDAFLEQMRVNKRMFDLGEGTKTDMLETQAKAELAEAQVIDARDSLVSARDTLASIVGREVTYLEPLSDNFRIQVLKPVSFEEWKQLALENNAEIAAQRYAIESAKQEVNKSRAGHAPRLDMVASYSDNKAETINTYNQDSVVRSVGFQLTIPLFSGGYVNAATTQAAANHMKAKADLYAKTNQVLIDLHKQYSLVLSSAARIDALTKAVDSAHFLIAATRKSIAGGIRVNLDLLNAEQQLYTAKRDLAQARYNYLLGDLRLRNTAGVLNHDDLKKTAGYFMAAK